MHGKDYYFLSRSAVAALASPDFYVGPVREMLQGVDLAQAEADLRSSSVVMIEIFADLWPGLLQRLEVRMRCALPTTSVFMTAVDPQTILSQPDERSREAFIQKEVRRILEWRGRDTPDSIESRSRSAAGEILGAIGSGIDQVYARVFHSSPEGPDREDEWTREAEPIGKAQQVLQEFIEFYRALRVDHPA
jgi:hypothetical protein